MKRNLLFAVAVAFAMGACDQAQTTAQETQTETAASAQQPQSVPVNNPNTASPQEMASAQTAPVMTFDVSEHDFGNITQGKKVAHTFTFKNTGSTPLVIESASAMCGCTVPEWPKEPIAPGESGKLSVEFDPTGKMGQQAKQVTIRANTQPEITQLLIRANIIDNAQAGANGPFRSN
jgi:uncharacterized cupredoxin-like copper-binding protein